MTASLPNVEVQLFADFVQSTFQSKQKLAGTTQEMHGIRGAAWEVPVQGELVLQLRGASQSLIPAQDVSYERKILTFRKFVGNTPTDKFDQATVNFDERTALAMQHAKAIGRRIDQCAIDELDAGAGFTIPNGGTNLTLDKLREASRRFADDNVDMDELFLVASPAGIESLLKDPEVTSSDFNTIRALTTGRIDSYMGFNIIRLGNMTEGGLPLLGNIRSCFAWTRESIWTAFNVDPMTLVDWTPERCSWLTISKIGVGCKVSLPEGVIKIDIDETA